MDVFKKEINGSTMKLTFSGILDIKSGPKLESAILESSSDVDEIICDLADLEYLTSAGLRALLVGQQEMNDKGGKMTLHNVSDEVREILSMTGFVRFMTIV